jgi:hypothetical protein
LPFILRDVRICRCARVLPIVQVGPPDGGSDAVRLQTVTSPARRSIWLVIALLALTAAGQMLPTADTWFEWAIVCTWVALALNAVVRGWGQSRRPL